MPSLRFRSPLTVVALSLLAVACGGAAKSSAPAAAPSTNAAEVKGAADGKIREAMAGAQRTEKERKRDEYRHPLQTLDFFGITDAMTVIEISPGTGWYTAILAPVLREHGKLVVAGGDPHGDPKDEGTQHAQALVDRFQKAPQAFDKVQSVVLKDGKPWDLGVPESADMVLTFRNLHNFVEAKITDMVLASIFKVLKHGGVFGLTDHRANPGASVDPKVVGDTGYIPEDEVVKIVEAAGFKLAARSEVNANPKDTKDYPKGVWTLPPSYALGDVDHAKYEAIGESDRMTLKFVKP